MLQFELELTTSLDDDVVWDEGEEYVLVMGGGLLGEHVASAFRNLGWATTPVEEEDVHGWFWDASYRGREIRCRAGQIGAKGFVTLTFSEERQKETFAALLALLDQELKKDEALKDFRWSVLRNGRSVEIGSSPVDPAKRPDPHVVLADPEAFDKPGCPPWSGGSLLDRLFKRRV